MGKTQSRHMRKRTSSADREPRGTTRDNKVTLRRPSCPSATPATATDNKRLAVAMFDFEAIVIDSQLSFKKNWLLEILDTRERHWWMAKVQNGDDYGYIPSSYVRLLDDETPEKTDGYMNVTRSEAERLLLLPYVEHGHYIVRPSSVSNYLALSVRVHNEQSPDLHHFKIQILADKSLCVECSNSLPFRTLRILLEYYSENDGLGCRLIAPCPRTRPPNVPLQAVEVPRNSVVKLQEIGRGNFGAVYYGKLYGRLDVAIKETLPTNTMTRQQLLVEAESMHRVVHDKIVQLIGVSTSETPLLIITEYMPRGNLCKYLSEIHSAGFAASDAQWNSPLKRFESQVAILQQVAAGMECLESMNIIHRDLRSANVLVGQNNEVKVADFGLAKLLESDEVYMGSIKSKFPYRWAAPEVLHEYRFSVKSDVWSFGVLAYEVITMGDRPYGALDYKVVEKQVLAGQTLKNPHDKVRAFCPPSFYHRIMAPCWKRTPDERPSFSKLRKDTDKYRTPIEEEHYIAVEETLEGKRPYRKHSGMQSYR